jgi:hypothetical protein
VRTSVQPLLAMRVAASCASRRLNSRSRPDFDSKIRKKVTLPTTARSQLFDSQFLERVRCQQ